MNADNLGSLPNPVVDESLSSLEHGGSERQELHAIGLKIDEMYGLSSNVHPYGPPAAIVKVLEEILQDVKMGKILFSSYPDSYAETMCKKISEKIGVTEDCVVGGNGSMGLIFKLAHVYLSAGRKSLVVGPTFGEYSQATRFYGGDVVEVRAKRDNGFRVDIEEVIAAVRRESPTLVWLCNPNNPTGSLVELADLEELARVVTEQHGILILDEAYRNLLLSGRYPSAETVRLTQELNVFLLWSLTKDFAIPGVRVACGVGNRKICEILRRYSEQWSVNAFAQEFGQVTLDQQLYLDEVREKLAVEKAAMIEAIEGLGLECVKSGTSFFLIQIGGSQAPEVRHHLIGYKVLVRDCSSFGPEMADYIRVAPHNAEARQALVMGLASWQAQARHGRTKSSRQSHRQPQLDHFA